MLLRASAKHGPEYSGALTLGRFGHILTLCDLWIEPLTLEQNLALSFLHGLDPERAHTLAVMALRLGLGPHPKNPRLIPTDLAGLRLANPIGIAAGFDKNAQLIAPLLLAGFGFIEIGAVTPKPQPGNPRPRLFRLKEDQAIINRFGFNNDGMECIARRLERPRPSGIIGANLGANKDSSDRARDYALVTARLGRLVDFVTINVSSPNTEGLRDLQRRDQLEQLVLGVLDERARSCPNTRVFLKIAPDLTDEALGAICECCISMHLDGLIATNTTLDRTGLCSEDADEKGGLSGRPLFLRSTEILAKARAMLGPDIAIIGVGGIEDVATAIEKFEAGANAIQLYTGLVYKGFGLLDEIKSAL